MKPVDDKKNKRALMNVRFLWRRISIDLQTKNRNMRNDSLFFTEANIKIFRKLNKLLVEEEKKLPDINIESNLYYEDLAKEYGNRSMDIEIQLFSDNEETNKRYGVENDMYFYMCDFLHYRNGLGYDIYDEEWEGHKIWDIIQSKGNPLEKEPIGNLVFKIIRCTPLPWEDLISISRFKLLLKIGFKYYHESEFIHLK